LDLPQGKVEGLTNKLVGSIAKFECFDGYVLNGPSKRQCQGNGRWSGHQPTCIPNGKFEIIFWTFYVENSIIVNLSFLSTS